MDSALLSLISACTALVASIAGPFVTLFVAKQNFNATVLSTNRQKWIESLRDMLAEFISMLMAALVVKSNWKDNWDRGRAPLAADPALLDKVQRLLLAQTKIRLLLKPNDADHEHLFRAIDAAMKRLEAEEALESTTEGDIETIATLAQAILQREWERVKHGT